MKLIASLMIMGLTVCAEDHVWSPSQKSASGDPNLEYIDGQQFLFLEANGLVVSISFEERQKAMATTVVVANGSGVARDVIPWNRVRSRLVTIAEIVQMRPCTERPPQGQRLLTRRRRSLPITEQCSDPPLPAMRSPMFRRLRSALTPLSRERASLAWCGSTRNPTSKKMEFAIVIPIGEDRFIFPLRHNP